MISKDKWFANATEAKEKWGSTPAYKQYEEKAKDYSNQKWENLAQGMNNIMAQFALCMQANTPADSAEAQNLVSLLQDYITENYYHCTKEILAGLGQMYVADERFQNNIDKHGHGTAAYIRKAIEAYCHK